MNSKIKLEGRYWSLNRKADGSLDPDLFGYSFEDLDLNFDETAFLAIDLYGKEYDLNEPLSEELKTTWGTEKTTMVAREIVNNKIKPALDIAREKGLKIIHIENRSEPYLSDKDSEYGKYCKRFWGLNVQEYFDSGGGLLQYADIVAPKKDEFIVKKRFYGAFTNTEFDYLLRNLGVKNLICVGFTTDICLHFTLYEAWTQNYKIVLLRDCTLAFETSSDDSLPITRDSVEFIEKYIGHTITSSEFIDSCKRI